MRRSAYLYLVGLLLLFGLWTAYGQEGASAYEFDKIPLPYHVAWGPYTITVEGARHHPTIGRRVRISDRAGHTLREIDAYFIATVDFLDLDGSGIKALHIVTEPDNNILANRRTYCFTR